MGRLPDFLIIGAARAGTTALFRYLGDHPGIYVSSPKEIHYFDGHLDKGPNWYASHFAAVQPEQICGEATPLYMPNAQAMREAATLLPTAKLIVLLRDPASRAWSYYWMRRERNLERRPFDKALDEEMHAISRSGSDDPFLFYLGHGMYADHLKRVFELYPRQQVYVGTFEELRRNPQGTYQNVCDFLEVDTTEIPDVVGRQVNAYVSFRSLRVRELGKRMPRRIQNLMGRLNARGSVSYPEMDQSTRQTMIEFFRTPNQELSELIDLDLSVWPTIRETEIRPEH